MIQIDIIEPVDHFSKSFSAATGEYLKSSSIFWSELEEHKTRLEI
jgi:hypothetical protein